MEETDVQLLVAAGIKEKGVLQANMVTAYFNYVNRLADGLGVKLEDYWRNK